MPHEQGYAVGELGLFVELASPRKTSTTRDPCGVTIAPLDCSGITVERASLGGLETAATNHVFALEQTLWNSLVKPTYRKEEQP